MAEKNVVRQDVVQVSWETDGSSLSKITQETQKFQATAVKAFGAADNKLAQTAKSANETQKQLSKMKLSNKLSSDIDLANKSFDKFKTAAAAGASKISGAFKSIVPSTKAFAASLKNAAVQKITGTIKDLKQAKKILTEGKTGAKGFATSLKNIGKITFAKVIKGTKNIANGFTKGVTNAKKFLASVKKIDKEKFKQLLTGVNNLTKKLGAGLVTAAKKAAKAVAAIGVGAAVGAFKLTDMASDLSETINKVDVSFGDSSGEVKEWSKNSIKDMGLAQQTALDMAALFGDMGTGMGIPQKEAANMSMELTQLGADLASFKNMDIEEVTTALNGVFTGETESLKRLGVVMTQTNLEAFALSKGIKKPIDEMSESEKVMLRYDYVLSKTANAQGDFARTGGGFANQLRMAKEQLKQIGTTIGGVFIGGFEKALGKVNDFGAELNEKLSEVLSDGFQFDDIAKITPMLGPVGTAIQKVADKIRSITSNKEKMAQIKGVFDAIKTAVGNVAEFVGKLAGKITDFVTSAGFLDGVKTVVDGIGKVFQFLSDHLDTIINIVIPLAAAFATFVGVIKLISAAITIWNAIQWVLNAGLLACPITWIVLAIVALVAIIVVLVMHWDKVKAAAIACWEKIKSAFAAAGNWFNTKVIQPIVQFFTNLWNKITEIVSSVWNTICEIWGAISGWVSANIIEPVKGFFSDLWDGITKAVDGVKTAISDAFQKAWDTVTGIWSGITEFFSGLWDGIKDIVGKIIGKGKEATGAANDAKSGGGRKMANGGFSHGPERILWGEAGPEVIIPLSANKRGRGLSLWQEAGQMLGATPSVTPQVSLPRYTPGSSVSNSSVSSTENNNYSPRFTLNLSGTVDRTTERTVKKWIKEALEDTFDGMGRTNPRLTEV